MFFVFISFSNIFREYIRMERQTIRMKILREKYLKSMLNNQSLRAKNHFVELKDRELKDKEEKIQKEIIMIIKLKDKIIKDTIKDNIIRDIYTDIRYF